MYETSSGFGDYEELPEVVHGLQRTTITSRPGHGCLGRGRSYPITLPTASRRMHAWGQDAEGRAAVESTAVVGENAGHAVIDDEVQYVLGRVILVSAFLRTPCVWAMVELESVDARHPCMEGTVGGLTVYSWTQYATVLYMAMIFCRVCVQATAAHMVDTSRRKQFGCYFIVGLLDVACMSVLWPWGVVIMSTPGQNQCLDQGMDTAILMVCYLVAAPLHTMAECAAACRAVRNASCIEVLLGSKDEDDEDGVPA